MSLDSLVPIVEARRSVSFRTLQQQYGDGYIARRQDGLNPVAITWDITTPPLSIENCQDLEAELIANGTAPFTWTEPNADEAETWILDPVAWEWNYQTSWLAQLSFTVKRWYS